MLNDVSRGDIGFDVDDNEVVLVAARGDSDSTRPQAPAKRAIAGAVLGPAAAAPALDSPEHSREPTYG